MKQNKGVATNEHSELLPSVKRIVKKSDIVQLNFKTRLQTYVIFKLFS